jgi:D-alanyl-D-alanine carboxypeptidase
MIAPEDLAALGPAPALTGPDESPAELAAVAALPVLRPLPTLAPEEPVPETVTRLSTSGGRNWGVSLGRHASHGAAERVLTRAVLGDSVALGEGLRKVVSRKDGHDATVLGLTENQALLACQRVRARAQACDVLAP